MYDLRTGKTELKTHMQNTNSILMIRPAAFTFNEQTAGNNLFQVAGNSENAQQKALKEFDDFVSLLQSKKINVTVINDTPDPHTPDSIFPNNWVSFHDEGKVIFYPMFAENRRAERKEHVKEIIHQKLNKKIVIDLTDFEKDNLFLEGTGSMVLDRENKIAYACISPRTNIEVLDVFCKRMNYTSCSFEAVDENKNFIYHTNVLMCVADKFVVICFDSIHNKNEKKLLTETFKKTNKEIIEISLQQMNHFAGNMLQLENNEGEKFLVMSKQAFNSLNKLQVENIKHFNDIIYSDLSTIETNGGGSARCMIAEVF